MRIELTGPYSKMLLVPVFSVFSSNKSRRGRKAIYTTMMMTSEEFLLQCKILCDALNDIDINNDGMLPKWRLETTKSKLQYLVHELVVRDCVNQVDLEIEESFEDPSLAQDEETETTQRKQSSHHSEWRFSVVYSDTWRVPVLYFTVQDPSGNPLPRDKVVAALPASSQVQDTWDLVSYDEHPVSGVPSYFLHPCQTEARLKVLFNNEPENKQLLLLSWMSLILPAIGYNFPSKIFQKVKHQILL